MRKMERKGASSFLPMVFQDVKTVAFFSGDRQRDSGLLSGDNSATRRAGAEIVQQGPTYPKDGLVYPRALPKRQIYIHGTRRTRHRAFHHIQEGEKILLHMLVFKIYIKLPRKFCHFSSSNSISNVVIIIIFF